MLIKRPIFTSTTYINLIIFVIQPHHMKKLLSFAAMTGICLSQLHAQTIVPISGDGKNYQVLDLTGMEKIQWGGNEQIGMPAKSEGNGKLNTKAIVTAVGNNNGFDGKAYAAEVCDTSTAGGFDDWYLPAKEEAAIIYLNISSFNWTDDRMTLWTSTEASGTTAVSLYTYNGTWYDVMKVDSYNMGCIRKVE